MINKTAAALVIIFLFSACATSQKYNERLNQEIGKTSQQLLSSYGTPTHTKRLANGDEIITYISINYQVIPDPNYYFNTNFMTEDQMFEPFTYGNNTIPIGDYMGEVITDYCSTSFYLRNNIITSWQWRGNSCVAL